MTMKRGEGKRGAGVPDRAALREAALRHLARYAATEAGLVRVLDRRIVAAAAEGDDVAAARAAAQAAAREIARELVGMGAIDDAAFAAARARRLTQGGRSRRAVAAHLAAKGVGEAQAEAALPDDDYPAALVYLRRRRLGPFGAGDRLRDLAALARAGFARDVAERALATARDAAEAALLAMKHG